MVIERFQTATKRRYRAKKIAKSDADALNGNGKVLKRNDEALIGNRKAL